MKTITLTKFIRNSGPIPVNETRQGVPERDLREKSNIREYNYENFCCNHIILCHNLCPIIMTLYSVDSKITWRFLDTMEPVIKWERPGSKGKIVYLINVQLFWLSTKI